MMGTQNGTLTRKQGEKGQELFIVWKMKSQFGTTGNSKIPNMHGEMETDLTYEDRKLQESC